MLKKQLTLTTQKYVKAVLHLDNNEVMHITAKARFKPSENKTSWKKETSEIKELFDRRVTSHIENTPCFDKRFLCGLDMSDGNLSPKKWSRLNFEIYVKPICDEAEEKLAIVAEKTAESLVSMMENMGMQFKT